MATERYIDANYIFKVNGDLDVCDFAAQLARWCESKGWSVGGGCHEVASLGDPKHVYYARRSRRAMRRRAMFGVGSIDLLTDSD